MSRYLALVAWLAVSVAAAPAAERLRIPPANEQAEVAKIASEVYGGDWANAKIPAQREALVRRMISAAKESSGPAEKYVLLRIARDGAMQNGFVDLAMGAIDELVSRFDVDGCEMRTEALATIVQACRHERQANRVVEVLSPMLEQAIESDDFEVAARLVAVMEAAARRSANPSMVKRYRELDSRNERLSNAYLAVADARETLKATPDDPVALGSVGRYYCFIKGQWHVGIPSLARCDDETLRQIAAMEITVSADEDRVGLGDRWWDYAEKLDGQQQETVRRRAAMHYRQAIDSATGLEKDHLAHRIEQAGDVANASQLAISITDRICGTWQFEDNKGRTRTFLPNGQVLSNFSSNKGSWSWGDGKVVVHWENGLTDNILLPLHSGTLILLSGGSEEVRMVRVKD